MISEWPFTLFPIIANGSKLIQTLSAALANSNSSYTPLEKFSLSLLSIYTSRYSLHLKNRSVNQGMYNKQVFIYSPNTEKFLLAASFFPCFGRIFFANVFSSLIGTRIYI